MFKKKKLLTGLAIFGGLIIGIYFIGKATGALTHFTFGPGSNLPTIKQGEQLFSTNLLSPKRFDFICFYHTEPEQGRQVWAFRLCGMPGDMLEIKNGNLYVNGRSADDSLNLNFIYRIPEINLTTVVERFQLNEDEARLEGNGKAIVYLTTQQTKELLLLKIPFERYFFSKEPNPDIEAVYKHPWTVDDFGPIQVPKDHYFVLGDNRHFAQDSRYIGFIKKEDIYGVVLGTR